MSLRKVTKNRGSFPNDAAMFKLLYLALNNISKKWTLPIRTGRLPSTDSPSFSATECRLTDNPKPSHLHKLLYTPRRYGIRQPVR
jgi:hypothetical protein